MKKSDVIIGLIVLVAIGAVVGHRLLKSTQPEKNLVIPTGAEMSVSKKIQSSQKKAIDQNIEDDLKKIDNDRPKENSCQTSDEEIKALTEKILALEKMVDTLIEAQEQRAQTWLKLKEAGGNLLDRTKKENEIFEKKLKDMHENFEKRLSLIRDGYLKRCPCVTN